MINQSSFCERVLRSPYQTHIIRAARQMGKTQLTHDWIMQEANQKILYVGNDSHTSCDLRQALNRVDPSMIRLSNSRVFQLSNGTTIYLGWEAAHMRGLHVDKIIADDAGFISNRLYTPLLQLAKTSEAKLLILTANSLKGSLFEAAEQEAIEGAYYEEYSYLDAIREEVISEDLIEMIRAKKSEEQFKEQYGPWNTIGSFPVVHNKDFIHLLHK